MITPEEIWKHVVANENGCLLWTRGTASRFHYGKLHLRGRGGVYAHRLAYEITHGPIPPGMFVCHHCDTPRCINPEHLFLGTQADNMHDRDRKGRGRWGFRPPSTPRVVPAKLKLSWEAVRAIRERYANRERIVDLARAYGVSPRNIRFVVLRQTWREA